MMPPRTIMRNGAAVALTVAVSRLAALPEGQFLALALLVVIETDLGRGLIAGRERIIGTVLGLMAVVVAAGLLLPLSAPLAVFAGLTLLRLFSFAAGLSTGYIVGGQVVAGSLLHHGHDWWQYAGWRTAMTLLGVLLGLLVARGVYSHRLHAAWELQYQSWLVAVATALETIESAPPPEERFEELRKDRNALLHQLPALLAEQQVLHANGPSWSARVHRALDQASAVLASGRDLAPLLAAPAGELQRALLPTSTLLAQGSLLLRALAEGTPTQRIHQELSAALTPLTQLTHSLLDQSSLAEDLYLCSRLLLLGHALLGLEDLAMPPSTNRTNPASPG